MSMTSDDETREPENLATDDVIDGSASLTESLLLEYDEQSAVMAQLGPRLRQLVEELLLENSLRTHSVTFRVKGKQSLRDKVARSEGKYQRLRDVTDVLGIRIITYFPDEVDTVARVVEDEFEIDPEESVDKRSLLDPDRFGYLSLHYIARLPIKRRELTEYRRFEECRFEVQIRSILQHAWAEIEHDLGYKSEKAIPRPVRRRFFRLAGLLEIADMEFTSIRDDLLSYDKSVRKDVSVAPQAVGIDQNSIVAFARNSDLVRKLEREIVGRYSLELAEPSDIWAGRRSVRLQYLGLQTIAQIEEALRSHQDLIREFFKTAHKPGIAHAPLPVGFSIQYLEWILLGLSGSEKFVEDFVRKFVELSEGESPKERAESVLEIVGLIARRTRPEA